MEFSNISEALGRVVIKAQEGAGQAAVEFESLVTGQEGFGYKGSRVYACCKDEWCLLGDLLYQEPQVQKPQNIEWDPRMPEGHKEEEDEEGSEGPVHRQLYRGSRRVVREQEVNKQQNMRGTVVAVTTDYDMETSTWAVGPQLKICLSDRGLRSGRVVGIVTEGMEVAQQLSRMGGRSYEPKDRITISDCGVL
ncbi:uncharacterized protein LOC123516143 isoform X2 [Portunus trituberculatus]|uniref:uncharacterized protein LOC123516143 isoform X2 n=1 Tax=Portunus trituberculatus TaxID=210409 RepID=UPI001E1CF431|nr:uncharacterized protein LOC123516143 isoform X2 [Portunus trituberculatus]